MFRYKDDYAKLCKILDYEFKDKRLLLQALTRLSGLNEGRQLTEIGHFQRLEFIGDKVLNLIISDILLETYPGWNEGKLTQETAKWVNNNGPLARVARSLQLGDFIIMGRGEEKHNLARENTKVLSDAMEALIGALWLDSKKDYSFLRNFIEKHWLSLGLIPASYRSLDIIIRDETITSSDRIEQFTVAFNKPLKQEEIENIFELAINECNELEIIEIILRTKRISQLLLDKALIISIEQDIAEQVKLLLDYGANPNAICQEYPGHNRSLSVLQIAILQAEDIGVYKDVPEIVELLLKYQANPNWQGSITINYLDELMLEVASDIRATCFPEMDYENFGGVSLFDLMEGLKKPKQKKKSTQENKIECQNLITALHTIAQIDTIHVSAIIPLLLRYHADPNLKDYNEGKAPLHMLCESYYKTDYASLTSNLAGLIKQFINAGADLNLTDYNGNTPLHLLVENYNLFLSMDSTSKEDLDDSIQCLIDAKANLSIKNEYGISSLNALRRYGLYKDLKHSIDKSKGNSLQPEAREKRLEF